jgi:hypothetical protein
MKERYLTVAIPVTLLSALAHPIQRKTHVIEEKHKNKESIYSTFWMPTALSLAFPVELPLAA